MRPHARRFVLAAYEALVRAGKLPTDRLLRVLEVGSYQVDPSDDLRPFFPGTHYVGVDVRPGPGVDVVADLAGPEYVAPGRPVDPGTGWWQIRPALGGNADADLVLCLDTLEHAPRPFELAAGIAKILHADGVALVVVPFAFQIHEHPNDYWRFTREGLRQLWPSAQVYTFQDPAQSLWPHLVAALVTWRRDLDAVAAALEEGGSSPWRTNQEAVESADHGPRVIMEAKNNEEVMAFRAACAELVAAESEARAHGPVAPYESAERLVRAARALVPFLGLTPS